MMTLEEIEGVLPNGSHDAELLGLEMHWLYVNTWNSFVLIDARDASYAWLGEAFSR